uniref:Putative secreted protein n=1 Tax=Anopheles marajoara TaxID=58244 RepID=A0A2M4CC84_9DIPT
MIVFRLAIIPRCRWRCTVRAIPICKSSHKHPTASSTVPPLSSRRTRSTWKRFPFMWPITSAARTAKSMVSCSIQRTN